MEQKQTQPPKDTGPAWATLPPPKFKPEKLARIVKRATTPNDAERAVAQIPGKIWDTKLLLAVMRTYTRVGRVRKALDLFKNARKRKVEMNCKTFTAAIEACERSGQWQHALSLLEEMRQSEDIEPNTHTFDVVMKTCEKKGQYEKTLELFDEVLSKRNPTMSTYSSAISASAKTKQWDRVMKLNDELLDRGFTPNAASYDATIRALIATGRDDEALQMTYAMKKRWWNAHKT